MNNLPGEIFINELSFHAPLSDFVRYCRINKSANQYLYKFIAWQNLLRTTGHHEFRNLLIRVSKINNFLLFKTLCDVSHKDKSKNLLIDKDTYQLCLSYYFLFDNLAAIDYIANIINAKKPLEDDTNYSLVLQKDIRIKILTSIKILKSLFATNFVHIDKKYELRKFIEKINYFFNKDLFIIDSRVVIEQILMQHNDWHWFFNMLKYVDGLPHHASEFFRAMMRGLVNRGLSEKEQLKRILDIENSWDTVLSDIIYSNAKDDLFAEISPHLKKYWTNEPIKNKSRYIENCTNRTNYNWVWLRYPYTCFDPKEFFEIFGAMPLTNDIIDMANNNGYDCWAEKLRSYI